MSIATRTVTAERALGTITPRDRRLAGLVIAVSVLALAPGLFWGLPIGKAIVGGLRILDGQVPYRDFWTMYAPGQFYLVAALFRVFGAHLFVQGMAAILLVALGAGALFLALRRIRLDVVPALTLVSIYVGMHWEPRPEISSYAPAFLLLLLAINRMLRYLHAEGARHVFVAGLLCGIAAWFKHDVAFYVVLGSATAFLIGWVAAPARPSEWAHPARSIGLLGAGSAATALPVILLVAIAAGPDAWRDVIVFPATDFRVVRGEGYPSLLPPLQPIQRWLQDWQNVARASAMLNWLSVWILGNVPQVVFVAATGWLVAYRRRLPPDAFAAAVLFLCCMPFFWLAAHVQQNTHPYSMAVMSFLVGGIGWSRLPRSRAGYAVRRLLVATLVVYGIGLMLPSALRAGEIPYFWSGHRTLEFPIARGVRVPRQRYEAYHPIVEFIRTHVPETEPIYVGLARHDAVVISDQTFYYLAQRPVCSRYNELHPGITDRVDVQEEIVADINRLGVRCIVLWRFGWREEVLNSILARRRRTLPELGARLLDDFIQREFEVIDQRGEYLLLWRRGAPRPQGSHGGR
jgi:hypothetical protein